MKALQSAAAEHRVAADGALRRQDRGDFETGLLRNRIPDLLVRRR